MRKKYVKQPKTIYGIHPYRFVTTIVFRALRAHGKTCFKVTIKMNLDDSPLTRAQVIFQRCTDGINREPAYPYVSIGHIH